MVARALLRALENCDNRGNHTKVSSLPASIHFSYPTDSVLVVDGDIAYWKAGN